jgi:hypothetical protein
MIAALHAVAKLNANAAPRTIVLIINCSLIFKITCPLTDSRTGPGKASIEHDKDNDANNPPAHFHLDERTVRAPHNGNQAGHSLPCNSRYDAFLSCAGS